MLKLVYVTDPSQLKTYNESTITSSTVFPFIKRGTSGRPRFMQLTSALVLAFSVWYFLLQDSVNLKHMVSIARLGLDTIGTVVLAALQSLAPLSDY